MEVKCTQCGGGVPVELDQGLATCPYCNSSLFLSLREGFLHYILGSVLREGELVKTLQTYLERKERRSAFDIEKATRVFWPYWQIQEGDNLKTFIASTNPITSLENAGIPPGDARPFLESETGDDMVEPPSEQLEELVEREGLAPTKTWLVHLPFWVVNYQYDGVTYEAWIDAVRGKIFADELPPTFEKKKDQLYALAAFIIFAVFFAIGFLAPNSNLTFLLYLAVVLPLYFFVKMILKDVMS